ncbi:hypothetical protein [Kaarinaea lacus]
MLSKVFGSRNERLLKRMGKTVAEINAMESTIQGLSDDELRAKTDEFRNRLNDGATLEQLLPEAFAVVREAGKRVLNMRHFDVQLIGGMVLNDGKIAEMRTGEGKTLVATLSVYLNALSGKGVHVVTVNDYLAQRDAEWMGKIYRFCGLSVAHIEQTMNADDRRAAYQADITYCTNKEVSADFLRDRLALGRVRGLSSALLAKITRSGQSIIDQLVQRSLNFARSAELNPLTRPRARRSRRKSADTSLFVQ